MNNIESKESTFQKEMDNSTKFVALTATFTALVFIATSVLQLAISATGGYFNIGESMVYLSALVGGPIVGFVAGGVGSALSDAITGYGQFAPGTFIIKGLEGYAAGYLFLKLKKLNKTQVKGIYGIFSAFIISLTVVLTTPSLWNIVNGGTVTLGNFPFDIANYKFDFAVGFFSPQFNLSNLSQLIAWNPSYFDIIIPGILILLFVVCFVALIWLIYFFYDEKSKIIFSCAVSGTIMVAGYFLYELIVLNYPISVPLAEVPFNILQVVIGVLIALPAYYFLLGSGIISEST